MNDCTITDFIISVCICLPHSHCLCLSQPLCLCPSISVPSCLSIYSSFFIPISLLQSVIEIELAFRLIFSLLFSHLPREDLSLSIYDLPNQIFPFLLEYRLSIYFDFYSLIFDKINKLVG